MREVPIVATLDKKAGNVIVHSRGLNSDAEIARAVLHRALDWGLDILEGKRRSVVDLERLAIPKLAPQESA